MKGNRPATWWGDQDPSKATRPTPRWLTLAGAHPGGFLGPAPLPPQSFPGAASPQQSPRGLHPLAGPWRPLPETLQPHHSELGGRAQKFAAARRPPPSWKDRGPQMASPPRKALAPASSDPNCTVPRLLSLPGDRTLRGGPVSLRCPQLPERCALGSQAPCAQRAQCPLLGRPQSKVSGRPPGYLSRATGSAG